MGGRGAAAKGGTGGSNAELANIKPRPTGDAFTADIAADGKVIGDIRTLDRDGKLMISEVEIEPQHRGKGHATKVYRDVAAYAKKRGKVLRSDTGDDGPGSRLSADAERVWQGFVRRGEAVKVQTSGGLKWHYEMK